MKLSVQNEPATVVVRYAPQLEKGWLRHGDCVHTPLMKLKRFREEGAEPWDRAQGKKEKQSDGTGAQNARGQGFLGRAGKVVDHSLLQAPLDCQQKNRAQDTAVPAPSLSSAPALGLRLHLPVTFCLVSLGTGTLLLTISHGNLKVGRTGAATGHKSDGMSGQLLFAGALDSDEACMDFAAGQNMQCRMASCHSDGIRTATFEKTEQRPA